MKKWLLAAACLLMFEIGCAEEMDGDAVYTMNDPSGARITSRAGRIYEGDEYISSDNQLYRVVSVDDAAKIAVAENLGDEPAASRQAFAALAEEKLKLIAMYSTHSDESYEPTDGTSSKTEDAGIYDVGEALKKALEKKGIQVEYSKETFLPHDAGAYRRSRQTAEELMKKTPAALLDLHRDGIPDSSEYEQTIDGVEASKVRLLVGRSNPNADANRAFAKEIKAAADEKYPGLIKDIYIGKGNYNQELYPKAILLEFGTHTLDKEKAIESTEFMADVISDVLFGPTAQAAEKTESKSGGKGAAWLIGLALVAAAVYALAATGSFKAIGSKMSRSASEISGGLFGKKPDDKEK